MNRRALLAAGLGVAASTVLPAKALADQDPAAAAKQEPSAVEKELLELSKAKWTWMADKEADKLDGLFHAKSVFVHMGGTMTKEQELGTIRSGGIHYKQTEIQKASVRVIDSTAIVLNTIRLTAIVGGNEVINPFEVTEVYVRETSAWKLASLSFTRLLR